MNRKYLLIGLVALAIVAGGVAGYFLLFPGNNSTFVSDAPKFSVETTTYDRTMGPAKAGITVLEYAAPSCPHCAYFDINIFPQFKKEWIDTGNAYYVFRVLPISAADIAAESIARCLPPDRYFPFIDLLYRNQPKWDPEYGVTDVHEALIQMGQLAGLSSTRVGSCIDDQDAAKRIEQIAQDGMTKYGLKGTPSFLVNGRLHGPFENYQEMQAFLNSVATKK